MKTAFKASFLKSISKIEDKKLKVRISTLIIEVENAKSISDIHSVIKIKGYEDYFRIRIGQYRLGCKVEGELFYFVAFAHRKDIYRIFP